MSSLPFYFWHDFFFSLSMDYKRINNFYDSMHEPLLLVLIRFLVFAQGFTDRASG